MAKPSSIPHKDQYSRMSHLYAISTTTSMKSPHLQSFARAYAQTLGSVAKKTVLRLSPSIKRSICKNCKELLVPGLTCQVRLVNTSGSQDPKNDILRITCKLCHKNKNYPVGKNRHYELWCDTADSKTV